MVEWYNVTSTASTGFLEQPPHLFGAAMVYDPGDPTHSPPPTAGLIVLFGGGTPWGYSNFTYVGIPINASAGNGVATPSVQWVNLSAQLPVAPAPREYASMAYDAADGYVVLFGGRNGTGNFGDTWSIQITGAIEGGSWVIYTAGWFHRTAANTPSPRWGAQMAYDPIDHDVVLYGGDGTTILDDTWDYVGGSWTQLAPPTSPPPDRGGALVSDGAGGVLLATGFGLNSQAWTFVGGTWNLISTTVPLGATAWASAAFDNATDNLTLFGGLNLTTSFDSNDTWNATANLGTWSQPVTGAAPAARAYASMVYDPAIGLTVLFGGGGATGPFNDTWLFGSWPQAAFPFSVTLTFAPSGFSSGAPPFEPGANVSFVATMNGGTAPCSYFFYVPPHGAAPLKLNGCGPVTATFNFSTPANYLLTVTAISAYDFFAYANLTVPVGSVMVPNWQPLRDSYSFGNYRSGWSSDGNCYGFATTAVLYWDHDIAEEPGTPYLPAVTYATYQLRAPPGLSPYLGPGMNSTTLAIMMHQTLDPVNSGGVPYSFSPSAMVANYTTLVADLEAGYPVVLGLPGHAVIAYGVWTAPNGTDEITISNSNDPGDTDIGYWDPTAETFAFGSYDGFTVLSAAPSVSTIQPSWLGRWAYDGASQSYDTQGNGWEVVASDATLKIVSTAGGSDSFAFPSLGDSQTFVGTITNSSGFEEPYQVGATHGVVQVYALPLESGVGYGIKDPSNGTSVVDLLQATNNSGTPTVRGASFQITSDAQHAVNLTAEPNGTHLVVGNESVAVNVSFAQLIGNASDVLNASDLVFPAFSAVGFHVENWSSLASTSVSSIEVSVTTDNGTGPTTTYNLSNGQSGLGAGVPLTSTVTFTETGLPAKELAKYGWSVEVGGATESSHSIGIEFNLTNGTYFFLVLGPPGYTAPNEPGGTLDMAGAPVNIAEGFEKGRAAPLSFAEKGLAVGRSWCGSVDGLELCSTGTSIKFPSLTPFSYHYWIDSPLSGQTITGKIGKTTVGLTDGAQQVVALLKGTKVGVTFAYPYAVTFTQAGLTSGSWSVTIKGHTVTAAWDGMVEFNLTNGTYGYKVGTESGYASLGAPAKVAVAGASTSVVVTFTKKS